MVCLYHSKGKINIPHRHHLRIALKSLGLFITPFPAEAKTLITDHWPSLLRIVNVVTVPTLQWVLHMSLPYPYASCVRKSLEPGHRVPWQHWSIDPKFCADPSVRVRMLPVLVGQNRGDQASWTCRLSICIHEPPRHNLWPFVQASMCSYYFLLARHHEKKLCAFFSMWASPSKLIVIYWICSWDFAVICCAPLGVVYWAGLVRWKMGDKFVFIALEGWVLALDGW